MEPVVNTTFPVLLPMLQQLLVAPANSGNQVSWWRDGQAVCSLSCIWFNTWYGSVTVHFDCPCTCVSLLQPAATDRELCMGQAVRPT
jgi:hypothetical protein